ncbi:hypothetical protein FACS1894186_7700 [Alphaproteobacteria bacterium]|nr:hypothetical protein FACS1894186_7700 [Alphaproteobacteria bacterium]
MALSLMAAISTVMFVRQIKQRNEMEEIAVAEGIRNLRDRLKVHVRNNTASYPPRPSPTTYAVDLASVFDGPVPEIYNGFKIALKVDPIAPGEARLPYHGFIVSPRVIKGRELSDLSAARIASVLGASGGLLPEKVGGTIPGTAWGTMNLWKLDNMGSYFSASDLTPPRVVVNLDFADINNDLAPDMMEGILFRHRMESFPEASNAMEWDLRFVKDGKNTLVITPEGSITQTSGNFSVAANGAISTKSTLNVGGLATFGDDIYVTGKTDTGTLNVRNKATIGAGGLTVGGRADFNNNVYINNSSLAVGRDLTVLGKQTVGGALHAGGNITTDGTVAARLAVVQGQPCKLGEMAVDNPVNEQAIPMSCIKGRWFPTGTDPDSCLIYAYDPSPIKEKLFTADGTFTAPCTGSFNITAVGGGGGGTSIGGCMKYSTGGGGGGSTAIGSMLIAGGGGGAGESTNTSCGGNSGEVETGSVTLTKDNTYSIKIGQGGKPGNTGEASGGSGYSHGVTSTSAGHTCYCSGCEGGNGGNFKNSSVRAPANNDDGEERRGFGGNIAGSCPNGGAGADVNGIIYGKGGDAGQGGGAGVLYLSVPTTTTGSSSDIPATPSCPSGYIFNGSTCSKSTSSAITVIPCPNGGTLTDTMCVDTMSASHNCEIYSHGDSSGGFDNTNLRHCSSTCSWCKSIGCAVPSEWAEGTRVRISASSSCGNSSPLYAGAGLINAGYLGSACSDCATNSSYKGCWKVAYSSTTQWSCSTLEDGYVLSGNKCTKTYAAATCPAGYYRVGNTDTCSKTSTTAIAPTYSCPSGYTLSGLFCLK